MENQIFLSAILGSLGLVLFIGYFIAALFARIMFDMLGIKKSLAFVPLYNTYRIYKEYKGRVWKKNWGVVYLIILLVPAVFFSLMMILGIIIGNQGFIGEGLLTSGVVSGVVTFSFLTSIAGVVNVMLGVILYLPIFETKLQKTILVINLILSILAPTAEFSDNITYVLTVSGLSSVMGIVFLIFYFSAATTMRYRVKSGEYVLQEKLDYNLLSSDEIKDILKQRGRLLAIPNKNNNTNNIDEAKIENIEYI